MQQEAAALRDFNPAYVRFGLPAQPVDATPAIDSQVAGPLALVGEQGDQPQWRL
jgi:hypothetical protein